MRHAGATGLLGAPAGRGRADHRGRVPASDRGLPLAAGAGGSRPWPPGPLGAKAEPGRRRRRAPRQPAAVRGGLQHPGGRGPRRSANRQRGPKPDCQPRARGGVGARRRRDVGGHRVHCQTRSRWCWTRRSTPRGSRSGRRSRCPRGWCSGRWCSSCVPAATAAP